MTLLIGKGRKITLKKLYISPELEIWYFIPMENMANGNGIDWYNGDQVMPVAESEEIDATIPGSQIPGWGN